MQCTHQALHPMDTPALNPDGSLKDAAEMEWDYSPTQPSFTTRPVASPPSPSPATSSNFIISSLTPADFTIPTRKHKGNTSIIADSETSESQVANPGPPTQTSHLNRQAGTGTKAKKTLKPTAITRVKKKDCPSHQTSISESMSTPVSVEDSDEHGDTGPSKKKRKRGNGAADILTVFKLVDADDPSQGYICEPCM